MGVFSRSNSAGVVQEKRRICRMNFRHAATMGVVAGHAWTTLEVRRRLTCSRFRGRSWCRDHGAAWVAFRRLCPWQPSRSCVTPASRSVCAALTPYSSVLRGITRTLQYAVSNTTRVCAGSKWVTSVDVVGTYIDAEGLGWHPDTTKDSALSVGWEGRGMTRGTFWWGVADWRLFERGECAQVRINADLVHAQGRWSCSLA